MSIVIGHGVPLVSSLNFYAPDRHLACRKHSGCIRTARCPFPDHSHLPMPSDDWSKKPRWTSFLEMWEGFPTNGGFGTKQTHGVFPTKKWTMTWDVKWGENPPFLGNTHKKCRKHWDFTSGRMDGCRVVSFISSRTRKDIPPKREVSENHRLHSKVPERVGDIPGQFPGRLVFWLPGLYKFGTRVTLPSPPANHGPKISYLNCIFTLKYSVSFGIRKIDNQGHAPRISGRGSPLKLK